MIKIAKGSNNVYADIGAPDAGEMLVKAHLAAKIGEILKQRHLTQQQAPKSSACPSPNCPTCCADNSAASAKPGCSIA